MQDKIDDPVYQDLFECRDKKCNELGYNLESISELTIRKEPYLSNLKLLHAYNNSYAMDDLDYRILEKIENEEFVQIHSTPNILNIDSKIILPRVYALLAKKKLFSVKSIHLEGLSSESLISTSGW